MKIIPENQDDTNTAQVTVIVGCGFDGDEGNEPTYAYRINPDGLSITRDTDDGQIIGGVELNLDDLGALCGVPFEEPSPKMRRLAAEIIRRAAGPHVMLGEEASAEFQQRLKQVWSGEAPGKVWGFRGEGFAWVELAPNDFKAADSHEFVTVDGVTKTESWKYTYYPAFSFGTYVSDRIVIDD